MQIFALIAPKLNEFSGLAFFMNLCYSFKLKNEKIMFKNKPSFNIHIETLSAIFIIVFVSAFILANFFIGFTWPIYLTAMAVAFILSVFYPRSGLYAIIFLTIVFERFFTLAPVYIGRMEYKFYPIDIIILAIFLGLFFNFFQKTKAERNNFKLIKNDWVLIAFIFLNIIYFLASVFVIKSNTSLAFSSLKNYGFYSLFYFISWMLIQNREELKRLFHFFLAGALAIIGFIFFGIINGKGLWTQFTPLSTPGVRILAFTHGLYLSLAFMAVIVYLILGKNKLKKRYLYWILPIWLIGIVGTMMRHLWINLILALLIIYYFVPKKKKKIFRKLAKNFSLIFLIGLTFVIYFVSISPNSQSAFFVQNTVHDIEERGVSIINARADKSFNWRKLVWNTAYDDFKNNPVLGIGTGKLIYVQTQNYHDYVEIRNIHNSFLAILIQTGFLGFGILAYFLYKNIHDLMKALKKKTYQFYALSILGALVFYLGAIMFQPYLETNLLSIFFWIGLGLSREIAVNL